MNNEAALVQKDEATLDINSCIPLVAQFIDNNHKQSLSQIEVQKENFRLDDEKLKFEKSTFTHKYWLLFLVTILIFAIVSGLIFIKNDTVSGMAMLSHIGAVIVGIIGGSGWEKMRGK